MREIQFFLGEFMNTNGSRNWLLWLAIIVVVVVAVWFIRNRMMMKQAPATQEVAMMEEDMSPETQVDAVQAEQQPEQTEPAAQA